MFSHMLVPTSKQVVQWRDLCPSLRFPGHKQRNPSFLEYEYIKHRVRRNTVTSATFMSNQVKSDKPKPMVVVGSINADLVIEVGRLPLEGETITATGGGQTIPGGKGANQAAAAARLGYPTFMAGQVGRDVNAGALREALQGCAVDLRHLVEVDCPSGQAIVMLLPSGENSIIILGGANRAWSSPDPATLERVRGAGAVLLQREVPEEVNIAAARAARSGGALVVLDAGGDEGDLPVELLQNIDILSPNETELARLTGMPTDTEAETLTAAQELIARGCGSVLVKRGAAGSMLVPSNQAGGQQDSQPIMQPAIPVDQVVDTTAAGDTFTAAYVVGLLQGRAPSQALAFAAAAASITIQRFGAMPSLPSFDETIQCLEKHS